MTIPRNWSDPALYAPGHAPRAQAARPRLAKWQSETDLQRRDGTSTRLNVESVVNCGFPSRSRQSLDSRLGDSSLRGSATSLDDDQYPEPGELWRSPSPHTQCALSACKELASLPADRPVWTGSDGRPQAVPQGSAEHLLMRQYGLDGPDAAATAGVLRRGGFHPPLEGVRTAGEIAFAQTRLGPREERRGLPHSVCESTAAALVASMRRNDDDPWHQFALDLARNTYALNGSPQTSLRVFQEAVAALPHLQQRLAHELHQGLLAELERYLLLGPGVHPDGAMLLSSDGSGRAGPRPDTRFHLTIAHPGTESARVLLAVEHDRPLSSALPASAGLDAVPDRATLAPDSAYHATLRVRCSPTGKVTVSGQYSIHLRYPDASPAAQRRVLAPLPTALIDASVHGQLTADIMDLHALALCGNPHAVALHLAAIDPDAGAPRITGLLALARELDDQTGGQEPLAADLARFAFAELRRCAEHARELQQREPLRLLRQAVVGAGYGAAALAHPLPEGNHWQHARQECCALLAVLFYRSADAGAIPALDTPDPGLDRREREAQRRERDGQLSQLIRMAGTARWEALTALLPVVRFRMWRTTRVQRPDPCLWQHGDAGHYLGIALRCLNAAAPRVATTPTPARTSHSGGSRAPLPR